MRFILLVIVCLNFPFYCLAQDDCEKFKKEKIKQSCVFKLNHIISKTNGYRTYTNYGLEALYVVNPFSKIPLEISSGIGYFHRQILNEAGNGGLDASDWWTITNINYGVNHLEIPVYFQYDLKNKATKKFSINFRIGNSLMYLTSGQLLFNKPVSVINGTLFYIPIPYEYYYLLGKSTINAPNDLNPSLNYFFPQFNYKINLGASVTFKHISFGFEYNYILKQFGTPIRIWPGVNNINPIGNIPNTININTFIQYKL